MELAGAKMTITREHLLLEYRHCNYFHNTYLTMIDMIQSCKSDEMFAIESWIRIY